jgi:hypothetical protein
VFRGPPSPRPLRPPRVLRLPGPRQLPRCGRGQPKMENLQPSLGPGLAYPIERRSVQTSTLSPVSFTLVASRPSVGPTSLSVSRGSFSSSCPGCSGSTPRRSSTCQSSNHFTSPSQPQESSTLTAFGLHRTSASWICSAPCRASRPRALYFRFIVCARSLLIALVSLKLSPIRFRALRR